MKSTNTLLKAKNTAEYKDEDSPLSEELFDSGCELLNTYSQIQKRISIKTRNYLLDKIKSIEEHTLSFLQDYIQSGQSLNTYEEETIHYEPDQEHKEEYNETKRNWAGFNLEWYPSKRIAEFMLQNGLNPNLMVYEGGKSFYNYIKECLFFEEASRCKEKAKWNYQLSRLLIAYGAQTGDLLTNDDIPFIEACMRIDLKKISLLTSTEIKQYEIDYNLIYYSAFAYPKEFYYDSKPLQQKVIDALSIILSKIKVEELDGCLLDFCVKYQYADVKI